MVVECSIVKDYYSILNEGKIVELPVAIDLSSDVQSVYDLFNQGDAIIAYFRKNNQNSLISAFNDNKQTFSYLTATCALELFDIVFITNDVVDLKKTCIYLDKEKGEDSYIDYNLYGDFTKFISDGLSINELDNNLKQLSLLVN